MKLPRRTFLHLAAGAAALPALSRIASAQAYPTRPITIVAPFPAGGATDIVSRTLAEGMAARSDHSGRERHRGQRHHRFRPGRAGRTRWLYAGHRPME